MCATSTKAERYTDLLQISKAIFVEENSVDIQAYVYTWIYCVLFISFYIFIVFHTLGAPAGFYEVKMKRDLEIIHVFSFLYM